MSDFDLRRSGVRPGGALMGLVLLEQAHRAWGVCARAVSAVRMSVCRSHGQDGRGTRRMRIERVLVSALVVMLVLPTAAAQSDRITATASFSQTTCFLGDQVVFQIAVENADTVSPPDLSSIAGVEFEYRGASNESSTFVSIVNGRRHEEVTKRQVMRWVATPSAAGTLTVPPLLVKADSSVVVETGRASVRVLEPERASGDLLRVTPEATEVYVNQTVGVTVQWLLTADVSDYSFRGSARDEGLAVRAKGPAAQGRARQYEVDVFGTKTPARLTYALLDGERVRALEFDLLVTPTRAGSLDLGPFKVSYDEVISRRSTKRMLATAEPVTFEVREVPAQGRPDNFTGLLGTHAIESAASPTVVNVGDPITLEVAIFGPEPMAGVRDGPDLAAIPAFARGFRFASEGWTMQPARKAGERRFTTTIRAADSEVTEIPAILLPFFDLESGEYRVARSEPIPLNVRAVREITAADAVVSTGPAAVSRGTLTGTGPGLWAIERGPAVLARGAGPSGLDWRDPLVATGLVAPPAVFAAVAVVLAWRSRRVDETVRRRRRALASAKSALRREGAAQAVRVYLADAFGATPAAITGADGRRLLAEAGVDDADAVAELISIEEAERYAGGRGGGGEPASSDRVLELLRRVDAGVDRSARSES